MRSVLGLEAKGDERAIGHGQERRVPPPAGAGEACGGAESGGPEPRAHRDPSDGADP
jgi:hypothetical protein